MEKLLKAIETAKVLHEHTICGKIPRCMDTRFFLGKEMLEWMVKCAAVGSKN